MGRPSNNGVGGRPVSASNPMPVDLGKNQVSVETTGGATNDDLLIVLKKIECHLSSLTGIELTEQDVN